VDSFAGAWDRSIASDDIDQRTGYDHGFDRVSMNAINQTSLESL